MKSLHNIEKSAFNRGEYIGYGAGMVWRITKSNSSFGTWCARPLPHTCANIRAVNSLVYAFRLDELSRKLDGFKIAA